MASLCYTQVNNITPATLFEGNTLLVQGVPGFLNGSGMLNTTPTTGVSHHQGPYDTRIDYRGGTVANGQPASLSANFNASVVALKGVYWYNAPSGFIRDPSPLPCAMAYVAAQETFEGVVCNRDESEFQGQFFPRFVQMQGPPDVNLAKRLISGDLSGFLIMPMQVKVLQKTSGVVVEGDAFKLPPKGRFRFAVKATEVEGILLATTTVLTTHRDGAAFLGTETALMLSP